MKVPALLAFVLAAILSLSVLSGAIIAAPSSPAFADEGDDNSGSDNDNSGSNDNNSGSDDESEDESGDAMKEKYDEGSEAELKVDDHEIKVKVEKEGLELDDGLYNATFTCTEPSTSLAFADAFEVDGGKGDLEVEFQLANGTYTGCEVSLDEPEMSLASFDAFTVPSQEEAGEEEHDDESEAEMEDSEHDQGSESKTKLETDDNGVEVEVEREDLTLEDGTYSVTFACTDPEVSMSFEDALEVESGKGKFEADISLDLGTYSGCDVTVDKTDIVLAGFDDFTVSQDEHRVEVKEKVKEKREQIISKVQEVRERIVEAKQDLHLPFASDLNYTLVATGVTGDEEAVMTGVNLTAWKSNPAVVIMAVTGGDVEVGNSTFTIEIGYAIYSFNHDAIRVSALAVDDSGDIVRLVLRGNAVEDSGFPDASGESIDLVFEGSSGPQKNEIAGSELLLDGTLQAT